MFKTKIVDSNINCGSSSVNGYGFSAHSAHSLLNPRNLVPDFPDAVVDGYCDFVADGKAEQAAPSLLEPVNKIASKKPDYDSDKDKTNATSSKSNSVEVVGRGKGDYNPKLLKNIKIKKP